MGSNCSSCYNNIGDNKIENLSYKNPIINQKINNNKIQDITKLKQNIKEDEENFIENKSSTISLNINISPEYITKLNKYIRGYLYRLSYKNKIKEELENNTNNLYNAFLEKSKNELVYKILYNTENNEILSVYQNINWSEFYDENPNKEIDKEISEKKLYNKGLIFKYITKERNEKNINDLIDKTKNIYKGQIELISGKKYGNGEKIYKDGSIIIGTFYNNKSNGWNKFISSNGNFYLGLFKNNNLNGKGIKYSIEENIFYKGDFRNNIKEGNGIENINGNIYEGNFENDKKNGKGKINFVSGDFYEGNFLDNKFNGQGHYYWKKNGNEYFGEYLNGVFNGEGLYKWNENEYYKGQYKNGIKEGNGEIKFKDGKKFICPFLNGKPNGIGIYENSKGKRKEVEFINGVINKKYHN